MKLQVNGTVSLIGSKALDAKTVESVLASKAGHKKVLTVEVEDANGQVCVFKGTLRKFSTGGLGIVLTMKGEGKLVEVESGPTKGEEKADKQAKKLSDLEEELLSL